MLWMRVSVADNTRAFVTRKGRFLDILTPGDHLFFTGPLGPIGVERYNIRALAFAGEWAEFLVRERPEVVKRHFVLVETGDAQVALVKVDGKLAAVVGPARRVLYWREAARITAELIDVAGEPEAPKAILPALERMGRESQALFFTVEEGRVGLLSLDQAFTRKLQPGRYAFWTVTAPRVEQVDMRRQAVEIAGQEILTRDKVSIRVNITAEYQVVDPVQAKTAVKDFAERLYRALQLTVRQSLGRKTLEEVLVDKTVVDEDAVERVRADLEPVGVRIDAIALKDIILPGDMREILNQVVAAEKQAQANLIRRREETAATRSLLNTAKLMEDNPVLVRLKELETLEKLVEKVDRVSVNGGFQGLLDSLLIREGS